MTQLPAHLIALGAFAYPSRLAINTSIWAVGLALQCALVFAVFSRRVERRFPAFATLIVFYPLRAAVLFALQGRVEGGFYDSFYRAVSVIEFPLQMFLAFEIARHVVREMGGWTRRRGLFLLALAAAAGIFTWVSLSAVPARVPTDRLEFYAWFLQCGLFVSVAKGSRAPNLTRISAGLAAFSLFDLLALAGRTHAYLERDAGRYVAWSYLPGIGYLAVVVFWLIALRREPGRIAAQNNAVPR